MVGIDYKYEKAEENKHYITLTDGETELKYKFSKVEIAREFIRGLRDKYIAFQNLAMSMDREEVKNGDRVVRKMIENNNLENEHIGLYLWKIKNKK